MKVLILLCVTLSYAFKQEIILYTGTTGNTGNGLILTTKEPNVTNVAPTIIPNINSVCVRGRWAAYLSSDYKSSVGGYHTNWSNGSMLCSNSTGWQTAKAIRYFGPSDTETPAIALYSETSIHGTELVVDGPAYANLPFLPKSLHSFGWSNWTFFTGNNFDGNATCWISTAETHSLLLLNNSLNNIHSVYKNCLGKVDTYFIADANSYAEIENPQIY